MARMSASSRLATETWQMILRYAIYIPDFLDPDAFEGILPYLGFIESTSPLYIEEAYWRAENTRNCLQRVSKSWDAYMRRFEHRFVRILDVHHGVVSLQQLQKAVRVSFGTYRRLCVKHCRSFTYTPGWTPILQGLEHMEMAIADFKAQQWITLLVGHSDKLRALRTIIASKYQHPRCNKAHELVGTLAGLRHVHTREYIAPNLHGSQITASHTPVTVGFTILAGGEYDAGALDLPSLRHLRLDVDDDDFEWNMARSTIMSILRVLGRQLLSFHLCYWPVGGEQLEDLWDLCPSMESFRTGFSINVPPPLTHPVHTLLLQDVAQLDGLKPLPEWPNLRKVVWFVFGRGLETTGLVFLQSGAIYGSKIGMGCVWTSIMPVSIQFDRVDPVNLSA